MRGQWSDALRDLDLMLQVEETEQTKTDIKECFTKYTDQKKKEAAEKKVKAAGNAEDVDEGVKDDSV